MIICGENCSKSCSDEAEKVADYTIKCLLETVPKVPGIAFLSGGQSSDLATKHLAIMNQKLKNRNDLWNLTFLTVDITARFS